MQGISIEPYVKPNGKTRWHVFYKSTLVGQFYSRANARRFVTAELKPALARAALYGGKLV